MNTQSIATAGNMGADVRSDCYVSLSLTNEGGIVLNVKSKVASVFGEAIDQLCRDVLRYFDIENAVLELVDAGALPFVIAARIEAVVKQLISTEKEYLFEMLPQNIYSTTKEQSRRSRLYLPGNTPKLMLNAGIHSPDGIILDLEDSVAPSKKAEARILVRNALCSIDFYGVERMVRINQLPMGLDDLKYLIPYNVNLILIPKCENAQQVLDVENSINKMTGGKHQPIYFMPIIESALGVVKAYEIATASPNVVSLAIGLEDYTADLGTQRTKEGKETFFARSAVVNAARAAGIQPIDSVFSDVADMDALKQVVEESKSLGFEGMGCIHPRQIPVIHDNYAPSEKEIEKAKNIVAAFEEAEAKGLGVVSLGTKMIDPPVVKRALKTLKLAERNLR